MSVFWTKYHNIEEPRKTVQGEKRISFMDLLFAHLLVLCLPFPPPKKNIVFNFSWDDSCMSQTGTMNG